MENKKDDISSLYPPEIFLSRGSNNQEIKVTGNNFGANEDVEIIFVSGDVILRRLNDTTDDDGSFESTFNVPENAPLGVSLVGAKGISSRRVAEATFPVKSLSPIRDIIINIIDDNPQIDIARLSEMLEINPEALKPELEQLISEGFIRRDSRTGYTVIPLRDRIINAITKNPEITLERMSADLQVDRENLNAEIDALRAKGVVREDEKGYFLIEELDEPPPGEIVP